MGNSPGNKGNQILEENTRQMISKFCFFHFVQQLPQLEWIKNRLSFFTKKKANVDVNACSADKYIYLYDNAIGQNRPKWAKFSKIVKF